MKYLLILLLCVMAVSKITLQTRFSKTSSETIADSIFYNGIVFTVAALLFLPLLLKNGADIRTVCQGCIMGVLSFGFQFFYISALKRGKMALTVIINNFSMIIPIAASVFILGETLNAVQAVGILLALIALILTASKEQDDTASTQKRNNILWLISVLLVFLSNGLISVNQKLYSAYASDLKVFEFVAAAYITAALLSLISLVIIKTNEKHIRLNLSRSIIASGLIVGAILGIFQCLNTYAASVIDGTILYSSYNCGVSVLSTAVGRIVFREKMSAKQLTGVIIGIIAIILLCI